MLDPKKPSRRNPDGHSSDLSTVDLERAGQLSVIIVGRGPLAFQGWPTFFLNKMGGVMECENSHHSGRRDDASRVGE